jgi:anti-anti-sigma regulatory factor
MITIQTNKEEDFYIIKVSGEVDASSSIHLDNKIGEIIKTEKKILVDLVLGIMSKMYFTYLVWTS